MLGIVPDCRTRRRRITPIQPRSVDDGCRLCISDPNEAAGFLPAWFGSHMIGLRSKFGLVLTTGDVLMISSICPLHQSSGGTILLDVLLDRAGVPDSTRRGWRSTISVRRFRVRR